MTSITINVNKKRSNVILGEKKSAVWGQEYITDKIGDISYQISPLSFYQVNPYADPETLCKGTGICRSSRGRDSMGSVLWNRNDFLFLAQKAK